MSNSMTAPAGAFTCAFCGANSYIDLADQDPPADYCQPEDHGRPDTPTLHLSREMWDDLSPAARADLAKKYEITVNRFYFSEHA